MYLTTDSVVLISVLISDEENWYCYFMRVCMYVCIYLFISTCEFMFLT